MDRQVIAAGLLRDLWQHYDHGGHSGRSVEAQILETGWPHSNRVLEGMQHLSFRKYLDIACEANAEPEQLLLFKNVLYVNDQESQFVIILWLLQFYDEYTDWFVERLHVQQAAAYAGVPINSIQYQELLDQYSDPYDLKMDLLSRGNAFIFPYGE